MLTHGHSQSGREAVEQLLARPGADLRVNDINLAGQTPLVRLCPPQHLLFQGTLSD